MSVDAAVSAWGAYDRDDPFALFAEVRERGPVHAVTLADGHAAWLVVGYDEARAALNDPRLSKDMQAALAASSEVVAEGLPGPAFARHMLNVDPPDHTRLRRLVARRSPSVASRRCGRGCRPSSTSCSTPSRPGLRTARVDLVASFAFPLPFTVICELLGVPEADRAALGRALRTLLEPDVDRRRVRPSKGGVGRGRGNARRARRHQAARPGDDLVSALIAGPRRRRAAHPARAAVDAVPADRRRPRHDHEPDRQRLVGLLRHPDQLALLRAEPDRLAAAVEEMLRYDAPVPHSTFRYAIEPVAIGGTTIPAGAQVIISLAAANRDATATRSRTPSTSIDPTCGTSRSATASISVSARRWPGWKARSRSARCCVASPAPPRRSVRGPALGSRRRLVLRGLSELPVIPGPTQTRRDSDD